MTPMQVAEKYVELGKQNGKTTAMIMSLPNEKCAILANDNNSCNNIKKMIQELRPEYNIEYVTFLSYIPNSGWRDQLLFRDMHVYIDNSVLDLNNIYLTKSINDVYGKKANND